MDDTLGAINTHSSDVGNHIDVLFVVLTWSNLRTSELLYSSKCLSFLLRMNLCTCAKSDLTIFRMVK